MVSSDAIREAGEDERFLIRAECIEEWIAEDVTLGEVFLKDAECSIVLGVGAGGDCLEGVIDSSSDSIHEEVSSGSGTILNACGRDW